MFTLKNNEMHTNEICLKIVISVTQRNKKKHLSNPREAMCLLDEHLYGPITQ